MKPGPAKVTEIILSELPLNAPPVALEDAIHQIICAHPEWKVVAEEKSASWASEVGRKLKKHWEQSIEQGRQPRFAFNTVSEYKIQGACFVEPRDPPEVKEQKYRRLHWKEYYEFLQSLTPRSFEQVCVRLLKLLGVPMPILTPYRADQGIDFFGKMCIGDLIGHGPIFPVFETDLVFWLVGQAKHYPDSKVATPDIRALAGSVFLGRVRAFPHDKFLPELKIRGCDPVLMLFFTTGQISSQGWELCRKAGIAAMDGEMISSFLADKNIGIVCNGAERSFDQASFAAWAEL